VAQNAEIGHIFLENDVVGYLVNMPDYTGAIGITYPASWNTLQLSDMQFYNWLHAEAYASYNDATLEYAIIITDPSQSGTFAEVEVLYHRNYGTPAQTTKSIARRADQLFYFGSPEVLEVSLPLDLDSLDGSKMDVIECVHRVNGVQTANALIPIVVSGLVSREVPPDGSLVTPQIPYLILHDPPGDGSKSFFQGGKKICREVGNTFQTEIGGGFTATGKVGAAGSIGVVLEQGFEFSVAITQDFEMTHENLTETTTEQCIEITSTFSTSDLPGNTGSDSDVFIGYGETWIFGTYEEVIVPSAPEILAGEDSASINYGLAYARDNAPGKTTTFILTAKDIEADIQAQFNVANDLANNKLTRTRAYNQMKLWEEVLTKNAENLANATEPLGNNLNFGGGTMATFDEEITTTDISTSSYNVAIDVNTSTITTAIVGANGFTGGPQFTFNKNEGSTTSNSSTNRELIQYTLEDDDAGDNFQTSVFKDPSYGTPIFRLNSGSSSSYPYEGGYQRDQPKLQSDITVCGEDLGLVEEVPYGSLATFIIDICNDSNESRDYRFQLNNSTNLKGADVMAANLDLNSGSGFLNFSVLSGDCQELTVTVGRNGQPLPGEMGYDPTNNFYEDLEFILYPYKVITGEDYPLEAVAYTAKVSFGPGNVFPDPCPDSALDFDGIDDQVSIPHHQDLNLVDGDFSFSAWVFPTEDKVNTIISKGDGGSGSVFIYNLFGTSGGFEHKQGLYLVADGSGTWLTSNTPVPLNTWSHVTVTFDFDSDLATFSSMGYQTHRLF